MANTIPTGNVKPSKRAQVPQADLDFGDVAQKVSEQWAKTPAITLMWTTAEDFTATTNSYRTTLAARNQTKSTRPQITQQLKVLDKKIDDNLSYVKNYITEKYKKEASKSYFPAFGMELRAESYRMPIDQNSRSEALQLMVGAIATNGFDDKEFGKAFWTEIKTTYESLLEAAGNNDSQVTNKVGSKNVLKNDLKKTMNALIWVIKGNYPDTYPQELRSWGFQKEKY